LPKIVGQRIGLRVIAGGAIMPDGTVGLILDVGGVVRVANEEKRGASHVGTPA
jgi:chemotaxis protein histidine kinase CheA